MTLTKLLVLLMVHADESFATISGDQAKHSAFFWLCKHGYLAYIGNELLVTPMGLGFINDLDLLGCREFSTAVPTS